MAFETHLESLGKERAGWGVWGEDLGGIAEAPPFLNCLTLGKRLAADFLSVTWGMGSMLTERAQYHPWPLGDTP